MEPWEASNASPHHRRSFATHSVNGVNMHASAAPAGGWSLLHLLFLSAICLLSISFLGNSLGCSLMSVLTVSTVSSTVADEGEGTDGVLVGVEGGNVTEGFESLLDISLSPLVGHVLNEDVVVHLSEITLRFGSEFNTDAGSAGLSLSKGACGGFGITEADETVSAG